MNETIGAKGGHNDYRRTLIIKKNKKKKEDKELKELEKKVKRKQPIILIKTIPIVILGKTLQELMTPKKKEKKIIKEEPVKEKEPVREVIIVLGKNKKEKINVKYNNKIEDIVFIKKEKEIKQEKKENIQEVKKEDKKLAKNTIISKEKKQVIKKLNKEEKINNITKKEEKVKEVKQNNIVLPKTKEEKISSTIDIELLNEKQKNKLAKLQSRKIIDVYEKQLKDIRYELRNLIFDYNVLVDEQEKIINSKEAELILDKLNNIILKIEELKRKIKIEDLDKYDDNYIYTLIEEYLSDFKDKKVIKEIKDSSLYILISEKLEELDTKKEKFKKEVTNKKDDLKEHEEDFSKLKDKYYKIEKINKSLKSFQQEQELILKEMEEKINKSIKVSERVETQVETMNLQTRRLLRRLSLLMFLPGARGAKNIALATSLYAMYAKKALNPKITTKKYKVIKVEDYSKDIETNINKINDVENSLKNTTKEIDNIISNIRENFSDYIGVLKECDTLLSNLEKVKSNIREKEYELEKIKEKQEKELERNNAKVLKRGEYSL